MHILCFDRILEKIARQAVVDGLIAADELEALLAAIFQAMVPIGAEEAMEEGGITAILSPQEVLDSVHMFKGGKLLCLAFAEMYRVLVPGGLLITADIDRPTTLLGWLTGWLGRWLLLQPELAENLRGLLPELMTEAGFGEVRQVAHVHGLISFFRAVKGGA